MCEQYHQRRGFLAVTPCEIGIALLFPADQFRTIGEVA